MGCCGKHKRGHGLPDRAERILPTDECSLCAAKHLATAFVLAQERGYEAVNRAWIVGELCLAQWHLWYDNLKLASNIREIRHLIQQRRERDVDWNPVLQEMDEVVKTELEKENNTKQENNNAIRQKTFDMDQ